LDFKKNNYGPVTQSIALRYENGMFLQIAAGEIDAAIQAENDKCLFVTLLRRFTSQNRPVNANRGRSSAPSHFVDEPEARRAGVTRERLAAAMTALLAEGKINQETYGRGARPNFKLVVNEAACAAMGAFYDQVEDPV